MSFVPLKKFLKKIFLPALFAVSAIFLTVALSSSAYASWYDNTGDLGKLFSTGEKGPSFTQYSGKLAELSSEGFDSSLVGSSDLKEFVIKIVNFALGFLGLIAVLIVIYGGVLYVTAAGEDEKVGKAKKSIGYAAIGLLIVMGSFAFVNTIIKSGSGGADTGTSTTAVTASTGFNASAEQIRALAVQIYQGFAFLAESTDLLKNIKNDIEKDSFQPNNFPSKSEILTFLGNVQSQLINMRSKLQPFNVAEAKINETLRDIDKDIDSINNIGESVYISINNDGTSETCDVNFQRTFWQGAKGASDQEICYNAEEKSNSNPVQKIPPYKTYYPERLYEKWFKIYNKYKNDATYNGIIKEVADNYYTDLQRIFADLELAYAGYSNISAIGSQGSKAKSAYDQMKTSAAYGYTVNQRPGSSSIGRDGDGLLAGVEKEKWNINTSIDTVGSKMMYGLKQQSILYQELSRLKFVQARLTADTVEGSSPLTVTFNALATVDPAGGSVKGGNIFWDLGGTQTVENLTKNTDKAGKMFLPEDNSVNCTFSAPSGKDEKDFIGNTSKRCVYTKPGTYTAAVKINSNDPTKYAPGISVLTITVKPPTTKIELGVQASGEQEAHTVMHYDGDLLLVDEQAVQVTANDAKNGITFDATATKDAKQCKWDFGDGKDSDFSSCATKASHNYKNPGKYVVTLEVQSVLNILDRKIFTLEISSVSAKLRANPGVGSYINDTVLFDASASKSDLGKINNYKWTIIPSPGQEIPSAIKDKISKDYPYVDEGSSLKTLTHSFKYPLNYDVSIEVRDDANNTAKSSVQNYRVKSQSPVAQFEFKMTDKTQPATVYFDGSKSYDPDLSKDFTYLWTITPASDWSVLAKSGSSLTSKSPIIKFKKTGSYDVTLKVVDPINAKEYSEITKTVKIDNVLDVAWEKDQVVTQALDSDGQAEIKFFLVSDNAKTYEINFGDGESSNGEFGDDISHIYTKAGKYSVKVTVFDESDKETSIERKIFISGGDEPIAKARVLINDEEVQDLSQAIQVSKNDQVTFDAGDSRNADGTTKNLKYSWDFGDSSNSSKVRLTHKYKELSPKDPGYFKVTLNVYDSKDPTISATDEMQIEVVNTPPIFSSISAIPQPVNNDLVTPVTALMKVYGAEDVDGEIANYRWWYFDVKDPEQQFGQQTTNGPSAKLIIGTRGKQGEEITYGFGLEITDSDGLTYSNEEAIDQGQISKLTIVNGANALPVAKFNVNSPAVFAGDKVIFTSSSSDPDGNIAKYIWDFDGDGFFNDESTEESSVEHIYLKVNKTGYDVRLKVVDDKGGESISTPIKIHVDSLAQPPTAAFTHASIPGSDGMKIKFTNTSTADKDAGAEILSNQWDFDTASLLPTVDSNGDGKKDNDIDSQAKDPERLFAEAGTYKIKLTVTDNQGNKDEVVNTLKIPLANAPLAAFTYVVQDGEVSFQNNSKSDVSSGSIINKYLWDFDLNTDSDGDGKKDNDNDSQLQDPVYGYPQAGTYKVKLTVIDNAGGIGYITNDVNFTAVAETPITDDLDETSDLNAPIKAVLTTNPVPGVDSAIYLNGNSGTVNFDFSKSIGAIQYYIIDKNIYFDTNGDGDKTNEEDFKTVMPGNWSTNFDKSWGKTVVKLTVTDIYGNKDSVTQEIKFQ